MSDSRFEGLTEEEINLSRVDPIKAIREYHDRTGAKIKTSRQVIESSLGKPLDIYLKYLKSPTVHEDELDVGLRNIDKAIEIHSARTKLGMDESSKLITSAVDNYKSELLTAANMYKGGDSNYDIDNADYWLWEHKTYSMGFIAKDQNGNITCLSSKNLWLMDPKIAKDVEFIDVSDNCRSCQYSDKCSS